MNSYNFSLNNEDIFLEDQTIPQIQSSRFEISQKMQQNCYSPSTAQHQQRFMDEENISDLSNQILSDQSYEIQYLPLLNEFNKINTIGNTKFQLKNFCQTLSIRKFIVKTKRTSSKRFKRKQYQSFYLNFVEHKPIANTFLIFGYIQIETDYLDFGEPYLELKSQLCDRVLQINHTINNKINKRVEFYLDPIGRSGLTDFNDLISHLNSKQNKNYSQLAQELICYQSAFVRQVAHMKEIKKMITKKIITENDLISAFDSSHNYFLEYLISSEQLQQKQSYTHTLFFRSNVTFCDIEIYKTHFSYSLLEILGINPEDSQNLIQISSPYQLSTGIKRFRNTINILKLMNSKQKFHKGVPFSIQTKEGIEIDCTVDIEIISYSEKPVWMNGFDNFMLVMSFNINQHQIESIMNSRIQQQQEIDKKQHFMCKGLEEQAQLELFLEKYYPNSLKVQ